MVCGNEATKCICNNAGNNELLHSISVLFQRIWFESAKFYIANTTQDVDFLSSKTLSM